jgi:NAD+ diphosphatase
MRLAETVTFGGSGLDRAGALRDDPQAQADLWQRGQVLALWKGRPLLQDGQAIAWLSTSAH